MKEKKHHKKKDNQGGDEDNVLNVYGYNNENSDKWSFKHVLDTVFYKLFGDSLRTSIMIIILMRYEEEKLNLGC